MCPTRASVKNIMTRLCLLGCVLAIHFAFSTPEAYAQSNCTMGSPNGGSGVTGLTNVYLINSHARRGDCPEVGAAAWLIVPGGTCVAGYGTMINGECWDFESGDPAVYAMAAQYKIGCGPMSGYYQHSWRQPIGTQIWQDSQMYASNWTVTCPPLPPDEYCTYEWIPYPELNDWQCQSPILISTRRDQPYRLTSPADGVLFDLDGDGTLEQISWTVAGDELAWLAIDLNDNGTIDSGHELIGDRTLPTARHGFEALRQMSQALDKTGTHLALISSDDLAFDKLLLWTDRNHNGISERRELEPLKKRFASITLGYNQTNRLDEHGNNWMYEGYAQLRTALGRNRAIRAKEIQERSIKIYDVYLQKAR
jgi:hypothetical protein